MRAFARSSLRWRDAVANFMPFDVILLGYGHRERQTRRPFITRPDGQRRVSFSQRGKYAARVVGRLSPALELTTGLKKCSTHFILGLMTDERSHGMIELARPWTLQMLNTFIYPARIWKCAFGNRRNKTALQICFLRIKILFIFILVIRVLMIILSKQLPDQTVSLFVCSFLASDSLFNAVIKLPIYQQIKHCCTYQSFD